jgi:glucose/mannose-6-phosphate isomerase
MQNMKRRAIALDDTHLIERTDPSNMYAYLPSLAIDAFNSYQKAKAIFSFPSENIQNIVGAGMGGSGQIPLALGSLFKNELALPFISSQDYKAPGFVDFNTLFIAISHSGEAEETINQYCQANDKNAQLAVITKGGKLLEMAKKDDVPSFSYSTLQPPRASFAFMFGATLSCLENIGTIPPSRSALREAIDVVGEVNNHNAREVEVENNFAKKVALQIETHTPLIYVEPPFDAIGARFSKMLNENAKRFAFYNCFPELRHNEIMCWTTDSKLNVQKNYVPILIRDNKQSSSMEKEVDAVKQMIGSNTIELRAVGKSKIARFCSLLFITDMIAYYEAILMNKDPSTTHELNQLKDKLKQVSTSADSGNVFNTIDGDKYRDEV